MLLLAVSGCVNNPRPSTSAACETLSVIVVPASDIDRISDQLVREILTNNEALQALCGEDEP